jgi:hypothetical protein
MGKRNAGFDIEDTGVREHGPAGIHDSFATWRA